MKHFLILVLATILLGTANAQVELSYCTHDIEHGFGSEGTIYTPYVQFPAQTVKPYEGATVTRILIGLKSDVTNVTIYIKNSPLDNRPLYSQQVGQLAAGWNEVTLDEPYTLPADQDLAIGYRARLTKNGGIGYSTEHNSLADQIYINQSAQWTTCGGSICLRAVLEGDCLPTTEMVLDRIADRSVDPLDDNISLLGIVHNMGTAEVTSYTLACRIDDTDFEPQTFSCQLPTNAADTFLLTLPNGLAMGQHTATVSLLEVNGKTDAYEPNNHTTFSLNVPDRRFSRRVVCEEYTGLWCGWCPRGLVGLELMKELKGDRFIAISIHGGMGDQLEIPADSSYSYYDFWATIPGAPSSKLDRRLSGDPFYDIERLYAMETATDCHIAVESKVCWTADSMQLDVCTQLIADADFDVSPYNVAYVVLEDSITGYWQTNYYSGEDYPFYGWEQKDRYTNDVVFDDVARGIFGSVQGTPYTSDPIMALQPVEHVANIALPAEVSNRRQVHVATLIIDSRTGYIANGHNTWPEGNGSDVINHVRPVVPAHAIPTFNLMGQRVASGHQGFEVSNGRIHSIHY